MLDALRFDRLSQAQCVDLRGALGESLAGFDVDIARLKGPCNFMDILGKCENAAGASSTTTFAFVPFNRTHTFQLRHCRLGKKLFTGFAQQGLQAMYLRLQLTEQCWRLTHCRLQPSDRLKQCAGIKAASAPTVLSEEPASPGGLHERTLDRPIFLFGFDKIAECRLCHCVPRRQRQRALKFH